MRPVTITVKLPDDIATEVEELAIVDPKLLGGMLSYGVTRRYIYAELRRRDRVDGIETARRHARVLSEYEAAQRRAVREYDAAPGSPTPIREDR